MPVIALFIAGAIVGSGSVVGAKLTEYVGEKISEVVQAVKAVKVS